MAIALELTSSGNSMTLSSSGLALARLPGAELEQLNLDTPVSRNPVSPLQQIAAEAILTLEDSRLTGFEALEK